MRCENHGRGGATRHLAAWKRNLIEGDAASVRLTDPTGQPCSQAPASAAHYLSLLDPASRHRPTDRREP